MSSARNLHTTLFQEAIASGPSNSGIDNEIVAVPSKMETYSYLRHPDIDPRKWLCISNSRSEPG